MYTLNMEIKHGFHEHKIERHTQSINGEYEERERERGAMSSSIFIENLCNLCINKWLLICATDSSTQPPTSLWIRTAFIQESILTSSIVMSPNDGSSELHELICFSFQYFPNIFCMHMSKKSHSSHDDQTMHNMVEKYMVLLFSLHTIISIRSNFSIPNLNSRCHIFHQW